MWQDLARRTKAVDEISFLVPSGEMGWLLAELGVAAVKWTPEADAGDADDAVGTPLDTHSRVVQVLPGPHALIQDISHAAVFYHADDMLERGYRLNSWSLRSEANIMRDGLLDSTEDASKSTRDDSAQLHLSSYRSVEGLRQMLRGLYEGTGRPSVRLPPHIGQKRVLGELDYFVSAMNLAKLQPEEQEKIVKRYGHFEAFFADLWDWRSPIDSLQVLYERWRHDKDSQQESKSAFHQGQSWSGSYYCTQGRTKLSLEVTQWSVQDGKETVRADLTFTIVSSTKTVTGVYEVEGRLEPIGRSLILEPIPDSWKAQPKNFVMVGLQGVVSRIDGADEGQRVFRGTVPIFGCDSFELVTQACAEHIHVTGAKAGRESYFGYFRRHVQATPRAEHMQRPIYRNAEGRFLYYWVPTGSWMISESGYEDDKGAFFAHSKAACPASVTGWRVMEKGQDAEGTSKESPVHSWTPVELAVTEVNCSSHTCGEGLTDKRSMANIRCANEQCSDEECCDADGASLSATTPENELRDWQNSPWNGALARLSQAIDVNRQLWRQVLQKIIQEKSTKKPAKGQTQVNQLIAAARSAGVLSFEMTTADGEEIIVKLR